MMPACGRQTEKPGYQAQCMGLHVQPSFPPLPMEEKERRVGRSKEGLYTYIHHMQDQTIGWPNVTVSSTSSYPEQ